MSAVAKLTKQQFALNLLPDTALGQVPGFKAAPGSALLVPATCRCWLVLAQLCQPHSPHAKVVFEHFGSTHLLQSVPQSNYVLTEW